MLKDIDTTTNLVINSVIESDKKIYSPIALYDLHINLAKVIDEVNCVANHYLALDFSEDFLQNSSFGKPEDKWRNTLNRDLERFNSSIKEYLHNLMRIGFEEEQKPILSSKINPLHFYGFVRDEYNIGFIEPCGFNIRSVFMTTSFDEKDSHLAQYKVIELDTFDKRLELQKSLNKRKNKLKLYLKRLTDYLRTHFSIDDILINNN